MAQLDRSGACEFAEYRQAFSERLTAGQLSEGEILMIYLRLTRLNEAIKHPVQIRLGQDAHQELGNLVVGVTFLDDDLKPKKGMTPSKGYMIDGVWNPAQKEDVIYAISTNRSLKPIPTDDGVFRPYDDGIDKSLFGQELIGAQASGITDFSSFRL